MNTMTNQEVRPLSAEDLDTVSGGMTAIFQYGMFFMQIDAQPGVVEVYTSYGGNARTTRTSGQQC